MAARLQLIHCAYHKCLTIYFSRVFGKMYNDLLPGSGGYKHFNSLIDDFYAELGRFRVQSVNNHALDLDRLQDFRISRFVRDPRDLIVSGYLYHKRGAEPWCDVVDPTPEDWKVVNGYIPDEFEAGHSYTTYLQSLPEEEGLIAEIQFRRHHYESMMKWPREHPRIITFRYEDIMGNEMKVYSDVFRFYELPVLERGLGKWLAHHYSAKKQRKQITHIRNPEPNQWKKRFTPRVTEYFNERYADLVDLLGYDQG